MNILVYGGNGWIGQQFTELLNKMNTPYKLGSVRPEQDTCQLRREIEFNKPTHIVAMIGRTHGTIENKVYPTID